MLRETALTYLWLPVVLSMVSRTTKTVFLGVTGNAGGANEAVIRMLISIGRCVFPHHIPFL
jgi:hypothetical protein